VVDSASLSVYSRTSFNVSLASAGTVFIDGDYDDGIVAWINGTEVYRSPEMPPLAIDWNTSPTNAHEASNQPLPVFDSRVDITAAALPAMVEGSNLFAVGAWTIPGSPNNTDLVLVPKLSVSGMIIDNCPGLSNPPQLDTDLDLIGNDCDPDDDNDGILDDGDLSGTIGDLICTVGTTNCDDNCQLDANPLQTNTDGLADGGDACDNDDDEDTFIDSLDNCPLIVNPGQEDNDLDGIGDPCDPDDDNDQVLDGPDNCDFIANPFQEDNDSDGMGDACDPDDDNDGEPDVTDNCPFDVNNQLDNMDGDAAGDICDCLPNDNTAWNPPSAVTGLLLGVGASTPLDWQASADLGANVTDYDTLRFLSSSNFLTPVCVEQDGADTQTLEAGVPALGSVFYYLIRADNLCAGEGTVARDGDNMVRTTGACP
jgi:hypothetical protein